jgi:thiopeptide-type bacteriocin biosynthesis protein
MWFVRYRSPLEFPHLRVRLHTPDLYHHASYAAAAGQWAQHLRDQGVIGHMLADTYQPEVGRYGEGPALDAAERVFAADSALACVMLRHRQVIGLAPAALAAVSLVSLVAGFLGSVEMAMVWLSERPALTGPTIDRGLLRSVLDLTEPGKNWALPNCPAEVAAARSARGRALAEYADRATAAVLEPLLHMHHHRLIGLDSGSEHTARRLCRYAAIAWRNRREMQP